MKNNKLKSIVAFSVVLPLFALANLALASEVTGNLSTGISSTLNDTVNGVVVVSPTPSPVAGTYTSAQSVTLTASGASSIHYSTDGTNPSCSTGSLYSGAISVGSSQVVTAISCYQDSHSSPVASFSYVINIPTNSGGGGGGVVSSGGGGGGTYIPPVTGQVLGASTGPTVIQGCDNRTTGFSVTTGQSCVGNSTTTTSTVIAGCDNRTTGFSVTTGQSCVGNIGTAPAGQVLGAQSFHFTLTLRMGSKGNEVLELQKFLNNAGYNVGKADGSFGSKTKAAVIKLEIANKLKGDGVVGAKVRAILNA